MDDAISILRQCDIQPTPQRIAVVDSVLKSRQHPTAEAVFARAREICPTVSRATVYNTLNLLVRKGLLQSQIIREGAVVFDPNTNRHHHFIDDETGDIYDIPWDKLEVKGKERLSEFEILEYQVVLHGRRRKEG